LCCAVFVQYWMNILSTIKLHCSYYVQRIIVLFFCYTSLYVLKIVAYFIIQKFVTIHLNAGCIPGIDIFSFSFSCVVYEIVFSVALTSAVLNSCLVQVSYSLQIMF